MLNAANDAVLFERSEPLGRMALHQPLVRGRDVL
jgi:hypothetical protein